MAMGDRINRTLELSQKIKHLDAEIKQSESEIQRLYALISKSNAELSRLKAEMAGTNFGLPHPSKKSP